MLDGRLRLSDWFPDKYDTSEVERPIHDILNDSFDDLRKEIDTNGNTRMFHELRLRYGLVVRAWCQSKKALYFELMGERANAGELRTADQVLNVQTGEDFDTDVPFLRLDHRTDTSETSLELSGGERGLDLFLHPPKLSSKYRVAPDRPSNVDWEVYFKGPGISTITRMRVIEDLTGEFSYVKIPETIDASIFGIDRMVYVNLQNL